MFLQLICQCLEPSRPLINICWMNEQLRNLANKYDERFWTNFWIDTSLLTDCWHVTNDIPLWDLVAWHGYFEDWERILGGGGCGQREWCLRCCSGMCYENDGKLHMWLNCTKQYTHTYTQMSPRNTGEIWIQSQMVSVTMFSCICSCMTESLLLCIWN